MKRLLPSFRVEKHDLRTVASRIRNRYLGRSENETLTRRIIGDVRRRGDRAVVEYTRKFDGALLRPGQLRIPTREIAKSLERVDPGVLSALRLALRNLEALQRQILAGVRYSSRVNGFAARLTPKPLPSVGCYIPGGRAAYPSTVLMTAGLARLAGVPRIVLCTPPNSAGKVNDAVLAAAGLCGVNEAYRCGGAQAIAALAYGTKTIRKVEKIVGPGGVYVALAKRLVSRDVAVDFFAGPTELVVVADQTTEPKLAAWDLIAQAEHGSDSFIGLVTCSQDVADDIRSQVIRILPRTARRKYVEASMERGFAAVCSDWQTACDFANEIAPEHLQLLTQNAHKLSEKINSAGLILNGPYAPAAASDYCLGTDHVLPTGGFARSNGGLTVLDFVKPTWTVEGSRNGLKNLLRPLKVLASTEGLLNHYYSVESRFKA